MNFLLNILWLCFGGFSSALCWFLASFIMAITIIGIPWARAAFNIGVLTLWPFGAKVSNRKTASIDIGTGILGVIGNIIWIFPCGLFLAIGHIICGVTLFISIVGIPFALQHFKLAKITLFPIGKEIVFK